MFTSCLATTHRRCMTARAIHQHSVEARRPVGAAAGRAHSASARAASPTFRPKQSSTRERGRKRGRGTSRPARWSHAPISKRIRDAIARASGPKKGGLGGGHVFGAPRDGTGDEFRPTGPDESRRFLPRFLVCSTPTWTFCFAGVEQAAPIALPNFAAELSGALDEGAKVPRHLFWEAEHMRTLNA